MIDSTEPIIDLRYRSSRYEMSKWLRGNRKTDLVHLDKQSLVLAVERLRVLKLKRESETFILRALT